MKPTLLAVALLLPLLAACGVTPPSSPTPSPSPSTFSFSASGTFTLRLTSGGSSASYDLTLNDQDGDLTGTMTDSSSTRDFTGTRGLTQSYPVPATLQTISRSGASGCADQVYQRLVINGSFTSDTAFTGTAKLYECDGTTNTMAVIDQGTAELTRK